MYYIPYTVLRNYISMQTYMLAKHGISVTAKKFRHSSWCRPTISSPAKV